MRKLGGNAPGVSAKGFTLVELMVVVAIVGVVMLVAAPAYTTLIERTRLKSYANELVSSFYLARSEAIKRNKTMTLCVSDDEDGSCTGGGDWEQGWIVMDPGTDLGSDSDDTVIKRQQSFEGSGIVLFELSSVSFTSVDFLPSGRVNKTANMKLCKQTPSAGAEEKIIQFTLTGSPRIKTKRDGCP